MDLGSEEIAVSGAREIGPPAIAILEEHLYSGYLQESATALCAAEVHRPRPYLQRKRAILSAATGLVETEYRRPRDP
jgi:hypothetical protein